MCIYAVGIGHFTIISMRINGKSKQSRCSFANETNECAANANKTRNEESSLSISQTPCFESHYDLQIIPMYKMFLMKHKISSIVFSQNN